MAPFGNAEIIPLSEVPIELHDSQCTHDNGSDKGPVILVVDDEPLVADTLSAILNLAGYAVMTAYGGMQALDLALSVRPALIITDVAMPKMNGIDLAMAVVENLPGCKVVLFSGHATSHDLAPAREAGYNFTLLSKPVHPEVILKHVSQSLRSKRGAQRQTPLQVGAAPALLTESA